MKLKVLGSAAGGGFPQWNCNCRNCDGVRRNTVNATRRTQSSIAISVNGDDWLLINASPDILTQIAANPALQPSRRARDTGVAAVLLMDAQVDHVTGLMMLRENAGPLKIYATPPVWEDLSTGFPIAHLFKHFCGTDYHPIPIDGTPLAFDALPCVEIVALPLSSKAPPYSPHRHAPVQGDNIGLVIKHTVTGKSAFYAPGLGAIEPHVYAAMEQADLLLVDGTFWTPTEMIDAGFSRKSALDMGHLAQTGDGGMIAVLDTLASRTKRKVLIHINNTNPALIEDGAERKTLSEHGIELAFDGMTFDF